jgi:ElaB/YqjD/DUF883 family membrane-anchored ribosome-binding protein
MNETPLITPGTIDHMANRAADKADAAINATKRAANGALDSLKDGVDTLRDDAAGSLTRAAAQVDELTRRGIERARQASADLRAKAERTGDRTVGYIQEQPVKSMLIAAATGAALAALIGLLARSRSDSRV